MLFSLHVAFAWVIMPPIKFVAVLYHVLIICTFYAVYPKFLCEISNLSMSYNKIMNYVLVSACEVYVFVYVLSVYVCMCMS